MTNEITIQNGNAGVWDNDKSLQQVKDTFGKGLDDAEWGMFLAMGKATGLNPFMKEIFAYKFGTGAATIVIARDGYRKSAQRSPDYDYHLADAVYSGDKFSVANGIVTHEYNMTERGSLKGAYAIAKRKNSSVPCFVFVNFNEYNNPKSPIWSTKPATMIKKVAESQVLRMAFQELFSNTYEQSEISDENASVPVYADAKTGEIKS